MEDGEKADDTECCGERRLDIERDDGAEDDDGKRDAGFNEGNIDAGSAEDTTKCHHQDEGRRHEPGGAAAQLKCENTDHHHGEDMIEARDRMGKAMAEAGSFADGGMGGGDGWKRCGSQGKQAALDC